MSNGELWMAADYVLKRRSTDIDYMRLFTVNLCVTLVYELITFYRAETSFLAPKVGLVSRDCRTLTALHSR